jgi:hypothetical protein
VSAAARACVLTALLLVAACGRDVTSIGALRQRSTRDASTARDAAQDAAADAALPASLYIEGEDGELSSGFMVVDDATASGGRAIAPPADSDDDTAPGAARARYGFELDGAGEYVIWGRIHSPGANTNRFWFQVDGGAWYKWRISVGDIWFWDDFHDDTEYGIPLRFALEPGAHELVIASCVPDVLLDRLYITAAGDMPPGNDTPCHPPHSIEIDGACLPSCGALTGTACGELACAGHDLLQAYDCDVCCHVDP